MLASFASFPYSSQIITPTTGSSTGTGSCITSTTAQFSTKTETYTTGGASSTGGSQGVKHVGGSGLSAGSIAGDVIEVLVLLGLAAGLAFFFLGRSRRWIRQPTSEQSNSTNNGDSAGYQEKDGSTRAELHDHPLPLEVVGKSV